jgi:hypothetical protein
MENKCVCCGVELPEGYGQVCKECENAVGQHDIVEFVKNRVSFSYGNNPCVHIKNSYDIQDESTMRAILGYIHSLDEYKKLKEYGYDRTLESELKEWQGHNALYQLRYQQSRTGSVDIDQKEPLWRRILYAILSIFTKKKPREEDLDLFGSDVDD